MAVVARGSARVWRACRVLGAVRHAAPAQPVRRIALTFDDLPGVSQRSSLAVLDDINSRLLATLRIQQVPAVGFVNERGLDVPGEREARLELLRQWVGRNLTLGNHTYGAQEHQRHTA